MLRFLQLSDVHFGAPLRGGKLRLSPDQVRVRSRERRESFTRALELVNERDLDGVLIPGDLFDDESIDRDSLRFVQHALGSIAPKPVFLAPGNHDPFGGTSPYNPRQPGASGWPDNVVLFAHEDLRSHRWPGRDEIVVSGCGVRADVSSDERRLAKALAREPGSINILLFHGSRDDGSWLQAHKSTYPFSRAELLAQGFDWTALGHYHGQQTLEDDSGRPRAAYAGCLFAGGLDEKGPKGALVVELGVESTQVEFVALDRRQIHELRCDVSGCEFAEQLLERVRVLLTQVSADDLALLRLVGRLRAGLDLRALEALQSHCFHLRLDYSGLSPAVDLESYPQLGKARTVEERFVARLRDAVEAGDARAGRALLYGLDALHRGSLDVDYEEPA